TFAQGITLGALLQGITCHGGSSGGGWWEWLSPFSLLTGASLIIGYALLGACWLIWKSEGSLQAKAFSYARRLCLLLLGAIGLVSIATLTLDQRYLLRWLTFPSVLITAQVPLATAMVGLLFLRALRHRREVQPFLLALALFGLCIVGLGISIWPDVIPARLSIWQAAAPYRSQLFMLFGAGLMVPVILAYTGWAYWVFRGKAGTDGYH
ncbi:MAG: cytochrome d ubiquinol oxidase subunit II, partial [Proteobacteria bacterium]|nr:cytochrome d ubiquinol oxidase subunit II [Pseudomonadota bacterium]